MHSADGVDPVVSEQEAVNGPPWGPDDPCGDRRDFEVAVREELSYLRDLFERRLLNEKVSRHAIEVLQEQVKIANRCLQEELLLPLVHEVLAVCDRLSRESDTPDSVRVTIDELLEVFYRRGLRDVAWREKFDPRIHESVAIVDGGDEFTELTNVGLERPGYWLGDRLVRPARVTVAGPARQSPTDGPESAGRLGDASRVAGRQLAAPENSEDLATNA